MNKENNRYIGLWIDHWKAIIVTVGTEENEIQNINSDAGGHCRLSGGSRSKVPYGPQEVASESKEDGRYHTRLHHYYQKVIDAVKPGKEIYIMGPGEAKGELVKEIKRSKELASRVKMIETTDKITENQIIQKVTSHFNIIKD